MPFFRYLFTIFFQLFQTAARIGIDYAGLKNNLALLNSCKQLQDSAYWGRQFVSLKVIIISFNIPQLRGRFFKQWFSLVVKKLDF